VVFRDLWGVVSVGVFEELYLHARGSFNALFAASFLERKSYICCCVRDKLYITATQEYATTKKAYQFF
jgi:hypothetical protein